jgi:hypothetical protein
MKGLTRIPKVATRHGRSVEDISRVLHEFPSGRCFFSVLKTKEIFHSLAVGLKGFGAVTFLHGAIQFRVGLHQFGRHGERIVKVGQRAGLRSAGFSPLQCARVGGREIGSGCSLRFHSEAA